MSDDENKPQTNCTICGFALIENSFWTSYGACSQHCWRKLPNRFEESHIEKEDVDAETSSN
jgi:hypothetical protein